MGAIKEKEDDDLLGMILGHGLAGGALGGAGGGIYSMYRMGLQGQRPSGPAALENIAGRAVPGAAYGAAAGGAIGILRYLLRRAGV